MKYIVVGNHKLNDREEENDLGEMVTFNPTKELHETESIKIAEWVKKNAIEAGWYNVEIIHFDELDPSKPDFANLLPF